MDDDFRKAALDYHHYPRPGKLSVEATKRMVSQRDLALAYSPGVAAACEAIVTDPVSVWDYTARGNLVAIITNGTAVLGLGNIGALASKPVMEGKAVLFKKFAGIDCFDIEVNQADPEKFIELVAALEPTFGGINLEDIKAPECFAIEARLRERMSIPVFHDDQHGTAIVCAAAVRNVLELRGKRLEDVKLVTAGAGAAALACVDLLVSMGLRIENVTLTDIAGVVYEGRDTAMPANMARYARSTNARILPDVLAGADIFLGLSAPRVFKAEWLHLLAPNPLILALANPEPEIQPALVEAARPDAIVATGRSDFPNQVNNLLCFPFIFRGALDVGATTINRAMELAAVDAIAKLAHETASDVTVSAYGGTSPVFGPSYIIPQPFDPRLILRIAPAVARAAMNSGVATRPIVDFDAYQRVLEVFVYRSGELMQPVFARAKLHRRSIAYAEGEDERVLRAVQIVLDEHIAMPVLIGRQAVIARKVERLGLRMDLANDIRVLDPATDRHDFAPLQTTYQGLVARRGIPANGAGRALQSRTTIAAAMLLREGLVDAAVCGGVGDWWQHFTDIIPIVPRDAGLTRLYALSAVILRTGSLFVCDTHCNVDPTAEQISEMTLLAAGAVRMFGIEPKAALLSHSNFGASNSASARKMRSALAMLQRALPDFVIDGEMHADAALSAALRQRIVGDGPLAGSANLLVMPNLDAANIGVSLLSAATEALPLGPILLGLSKPLQVLVSSVTARGIVNMSAIAVGDVKATHQGRLALRPAIVAANDANLGL